MSKRAIISISEGNFEEGFSIILQIGEEGKPPTLTLSENLRLPPVSELLENYWQWQESYYQAPIIRQARIVRIVVPENQITNRSDSSNQSPQDCKIATQEFTEMMIKWFENPTFGYIRETIQEEVGKQEALRVILETNDLRLWRLPWHLWTLFERRPKSELSLSLKSYRRIPCKNLQNPVKVLAILGNSENLDLEEDRQQLEKLKKLGAKITWLIQPSQRVLRDLLWNKHWDILFFAGHSSTEIVTEHGVLQINETEEPLSLWELRNTLKASVDKGLQLAIFNSCDGLGLARDLAEVNIPYVIVMREPVPNQIAERFLEYFLASFSQGKSLNLSVRDARIRLKDDQKEHHLPCADWLPVIYQNQASSPLYWHKRGYRKWLLPLGLVFSPLALIPFFSYPLVSQLISECENLLIKENLTTAKQEGVNACQSKNFVLARKKFEESLFINPNDPETRIYLENTKIGNRPAFNIAVSVPIGSNLNVAQEMLRGVAQAQIKVNQTGGITGRFLKVTIANDNNDPKIGTEIAKTLIKDPRIIAVAGHNASDVSVAVAPLYNQGKLVMITPTSFSDMLSSRGDYVFRIVFSIRFVADTLADEVIGQNKKKVAICSSTTAVDNESFRNQFTNSLQAKGGEYIPVYCNFDDPNFDPQAKIAEIISSGADSLLVAPHVDRIEKAINIAKANQGRLTLFASPTLYTSITLNSGQGNVNGLILCVPWHPDNPSTFPKAAPFLNEATKLWKGPVNWRTANSYDATLVIAEGLKKSKTREELKNAIKNSSFSLQGVTGKLKFLPSGDRQFNPDSILVVKVQPNSNTESKYDFKLLNR